MIRKTVVAAIICVAVVGACHRGAGATMAPALRALVPSRADVSSGQVVDVRVDGEHFDAFNTVHFGEITLTQVPRLSATTLRFSVPLDDAQRRPRGEAPPQMLTAGTYAVRVTTSHGTSNALAFVLQRGGAR